MIPLSTSSTTSTSGGTVVCAWCNVQLRAGDPARPISHGVCAKCSASLLDDADLPPLSQRRKSRR